MLNGKYDLIKTDSEFKVDKLLLEVEQKNLQINQILVDKTKLEESILSMKNRKLTVKERISGKIINNDEN